MEKEKPIDNDGLRSISKDATSHTFSVIGELNDDEMNARVTQAKRVANFYRQALNSDLAIKENGIEKNFEDLPPEDQQEILNVFLIQHGICYAVLDLQRREKGE